MKTLLAALFLLSGCAPGLATIPQGTYTFPDALDPRAIADHAGQEVEFRDGRFTIRRDGEMRVEGSYSVESDRLALTDEGGVWACAGPESRTMTYAFARKGDCVALHPLARDPCERLGSAGADLVLVPGPAPIAERAEVPAELRSSWDPMWNASDVGKAVWADRVFSSDAVVEFLGSRYDGIERIDSGWLRALATAQRIEVVPFAFTVSAEQILEAGRTRALFRAPRGEAVVRVGRYRTTWSKGVDRSWKVTRLEMPRLPGGKRGR